MAHAHLLVIGGGPGGYHAAIRAAQLGQRVTIVDEGTWGGVCLHRGCIPSKGAIHLARILHEAKRQESRGLTLEGARFDLKTFQAWKRQELQTLAKGVEKLLESNGCTLVRGRAELTGPQEATVGNDRIAFDHCVLAPGSRSAELPHLSTDGDRVIGSRHALDLEEVPESVAVIGGGFIGLELGQWLHHLGSKVTVVEALPRLLPTAEEDLGRGIQTVFKKAGIEVRTGTKAAKASRTPKGIHLALEGDEPGGLEVSKVLVAVGRAPRTQGLGLEKGNVKADAKGYIQVDAQCRTSNPRIFAIGDAVPGPALAHKAIHEGFVVADVLAGGPAVVEYRALPWFCYTTPEVASVGLTEAEARERGLDPRAATFHLRGLGIAKITAELDGFVKVVAGQDDAVLGVHMLAPHATEMIHAATVAIEMGATLEDLAWTVHAHPTLPEAMLEAVEAVHGRAIHQPPRKPPRSV